jgi:HupE / UreJ protein
VLNRSFILSWIWAFFTLWPQSLSAHQQPTTIVLLEVYPNRVAMELQIPLTELELAFGNDVSKDPNALMGKVRPQFDEYLTAHIHPMTRDGRPWTVTVLDLTVGGAEQTQSGPYREVIVHLDLRPPVDASARSMVLNYDLIMHQVVTHKALVSIRRDWESGLNGEESVETGVIAVDTQTTKIFPLEINLEKGSWWQGFKGMLSLGMRHIREGTDHLLFLLVLLLPAPLLVRNRLWGEFGGTRYSLLRLVKIITAFTVGHSVTLLLGALGWLRLPQQPVEVLIAFSILVSAVHAIRPIFPGKEMYVAAGLGLVHGLAFATVLVDLNFRCGTDGVEYFGLQRRHRDHAVSCYRDHRSIAYPAEPYPGVWMGQNRRCDIGRNRRCRMDR